MAKKSAHSLATEVNKQLAELVYDTVGKLTKADTNRIWTELKKYVPDTADGPMERLLDVMIDREDLAVNLALVLATAVHGQRWELIEPFDLARVAKRHSRKRSG